MRVLEAPAQGARAKRFEMLIVPHLPLGRRLARRLTREDQDAEDVLQDASLRAYRFIDSCRGENPKAWFLAIVRNTAFSWLRHNRREDVPVSLDEAGGPLERETLVERETPESILLAEESKRRWRQMSSTLSPVHRQVLALREDAEMSYQEIADHIGIPTGTVMSRLARGRAARARCDQVILLA